MSYNPNIMPKNMEEWELLILHYLGKEQETAAADSRHKPLTRAEIEAHFKAAGYYPQDVETGPVLTPEQLHAQKIAQIDAETSAAILAGFDYPVNGQTLHFNYDAFDQQNFADTANACLLAKSGVAGLPTSVTWNAYKTGTGELVRLTLTAEQFLALYTGGALAHKAACMEAGGAKKAALA